MKCEKRSDGYRLIIDEARGFQRHIKVTEKSIVVTLVDKDGKTVDSATFPHEDLVATPDDWEDGL
jgi:hypothetical protein